MSLNENLCRYTKPQIILNHKFFNICYQFIINPNSDDGLGMWFVWGRRGGHIGSWWGNRRERDRWGDLGVDGWIILGWISRRWVVGMWIGLGLAQDRDWWRKLVNAVMNLRVP